MKNTYSEMKDSGVEWIGKIPSNWKTVPAKFFIKLQAGYPFDSDKFDNFQGIPLIRIRDITSGYAGTFYKGDYSNEYIVQNNDLLVGMDGDFNVRWWQGGEAILNQRCCRIFGQDGLLLRYFYYLLPFYLKIINELAYSTTVKHLSNSDILKGRICLPSFSEQTAIAAYLDEKCAAIDEISEEAKASIEEYKAWKSSVIFEAVTKGLNPNAEMKDSGVEWIGKVPTGWKVCKTLRCLAMPITDGPHTTPELFDSGIPFVSAEAVSCGKGSIDFSHIRGFISSEFYEECCKKYIPQRDDIYMIKSGATTGKVAIVDVDHKFTIWSPLAVFRVNTQRMLARYLFYFLQSEAYQKQVELEWSFGTQQNIGMRVLENLLVCMPKLSDQQAIVSFLDKKCVTIDGIIAEKEALIADMEAYKKSLIFETVTGKRKVC